MPPTEQIANVFVTSFFEGLARDPASLTDFYGHHAVITINDFENGIVEAYDGDVRTTFQKWASILKGSQLSVDSVNAAPIFSGLNVFVSFSAVSNGLRQYYHIMTSLEVNPQEYSECYYIRHQLISRIGAAPVEVPAPVEEPVAPAPAPVEKAKPAKQAPAPHKEEAAPAPAPKTPEPEPVPEVAAAPAAAAPTPKAEEAAPAPVEEPAAPAPAAGAKPKSWASLASAGAKAKITGAPVRVIAHDAAAKPAAGAAAAPAAAPKAGAAEAPAREHKPREPREPREPRVHEPVGDCLMFNTKTAVTDDEIKAALGPLASSLVSLRNNSSTGRVFMDFAQGVSAFDEIHKAAPSIGEEKIAVYRQKERALRRE